MLAFWVFGPAKSVIDGTIATDPTGYGYHSVNIGSVSFALEHHLPEIFT
ncbi:hypothetical protein PLCT2_00177 [Planctomycetaceae bacterium]|nr:hypothetical protein PLCT2_00177 [Planctomycetaceae bacterium]